MVFLANIFYVLFGISFLSMAIAWIAFARFSMARIEREIREEGLSRPGSWDGVGARALWYSHAIVIPLGIWNFPNNPFFDVMTARRHAKPIDKTLGLVFLISGYTFVVVGLVGSFGLGLY